MRGDPRHLRAELREMRREMEESRRLLRKQPEAVGTSTFRPAQVPYGVDLAAAWSWRLLVVGGAMALLLYLVNFFLVVVMPLVIALLLAALMTPVVSWLGRRGMPHKLAALFVVLIGLASLALLLTFVGNQVAQGASDLSDQVNDGLAQIQDWLRDGPLNVTDEQINAALASAQDQLQSFGEDAVSRLGEVGNIIGEIVAGIFIVLFATYFFLADGALIWAWLVRIFPRAGRRKADSSGRVAWASLTQFVRATVLVAAADAIGVMVGAAILQVPFVGAIGILVFIGAFVPLVGAFVSGTVAVLVALVAQGPVIALIMFAVIVAVQQVEAHVLQPFLMGRFVSVHPLGVIVALAMGIIVAGVAGALVAVPLAASINAVVQHLAADTDVGEGVTDDSDEEGAVGETDDVPADDPEAPVTAPESGTTSEPDA